MGWFKVDDQFHASHKLMSIPKRYRFQVAGLWTIAGSWVASQETDGFVPNYMLDVWQATDSLVSALVNAGLWERESGGYRFVHWRKSQDGKYRKNIRKSVKRAVYERDGHRCVFCGTTENLTLDHIVRYADGGPDTEDNLRVLCMKCNQSRETKMQEVNRALV